MGTFGLTFDELRAANLKRIPLFKNGKGELAHPPTVQHDADCAVTTKGDSWACDHGCADRTPPGADWSLGEWVTAVCGELGELANLIKKVRRGDLKLDEARAELAKELADVACYLDILALQCGVDLGDAVVNKFNEVSKRIGVEVFLGVRIIEQPAISKQRLLEVLQDAKSAIKLYGSDTDPVVQAHVDELDDTINKIA